MNHNILIINELVNYWWNDDKWLKNKGIDL